VVVPVFVVADGVDVEVPHDPGRAVFSYNSAQNDLAFCNSDMPLYCTVLVGVPVELSVVVEVVEVGWIGPLLIFLLGLPQRTKANDQSFRVNQKP